MSDDSLGVDVTAGATTLMEVLDAAAAAGYEDQFVAVEGGGIRCGACGAIVPAADLAVTRTDRLEGASDAADMLLVARTDCPGCGAGGTLVLGYGPNASDADVAALEDLDLPDGAADPTQD